MNNINQKINDLALLVVYREREVYQYQVNIDNYTHILQTLPSGEIPEEVAKYMSTKVEELPFDTSPDIFKQVANYQYRNHIAYLIRTEMIEQNKSIHILEALKAQIPADQLDALVAEALVIVNAQNTTT